MEFFARLVRAQGQVVLAACDAHLIGREFRQGQVVLRVSPAYYGNSRVGREELESMLREATIITLVGENALAVAEDIGLCKRSDAKTVEGVPHLNIYFI